MCIQFNNPDCEDDKPTPYAQPVPAADTKPADESKQPDSYGGGASGGYVPNYAGAQPQQQQQSGAVKVGSLMFATLVAAAALL